MKKKNSKAKGTLPTHYITFDEMFERIAKNEMVQPKQIDVITTLKSLDFLSTKQVVMLYPITLKKLRQVKKIIGFKKNVIAKRNGEIIYSKDLIFSKQDLDKYFNTGSVPPANVD